MKKVLYFGIVIFVASIAFSCSSDDDDDNAGNNGDDTASANFKVNQEVFTLSPLNYIISNFVSSPLEFSNGKVFISATVSIMGFKGDHAKSGNASFSLHYQEGQGVAGVYPIYNGNDFNSTLEESDRLCNGLLTISGVSDLQNSVVEITGNSPQGSVELIHNVDDTYTLKFDGLFENMEDESTFPVEIDLTHQARVEDI